MNLKRALKCPFFDGKLTVDHWPTSGNGDIYITDKYFCGTILICFALSCSIRHYPLFSLSQLPGLRVGSLHYGTIFLSKLFYLPIRVDHLHYPPTLFLFAYFLSGLSRLSSYLSPTCLFYSWGLDTMEQSTHLNYLPVLLLLFTYSANGISTLSSYSPPLHLFSTELSTLSSYTFPFYL